MAHLRRSPITDVVAALVFLLVTTASVDAQLSPGFYASSCPNIAGIVRSVMSPTIFRDPTMGASLLRLFFHDCFVNGCDASVLLDDAPSFRSEKGAGPNAGTLRGLDVIDAIKGQLESACPGTVSCADILAMAAREAVVLLGGPSWNVPLGRRDSTTADINAANANLPSPSSSLGSLMAAFSAKGLGLRDLVALSGAHTIGQAHCVNFRAHIYGDRNINPSFAAFRRQQCPVNGGDGFTAPLDATTPTRFDNAYYRNLVNRAALLHSDQELFNGGQADSLVLLYSNNQGAFFSDFANAMVRLSGIGVLTGGNGIIRGNCHLAAAAAQRHKSGSNSTNKNKNKNKDKDKSKSKSKNKY